MLQCSQHTFNNVKFIFKVNMFLISNTYNDNKAKHLNPKRFGSDKNKGHHTFTYKSQSVKIYTITSKQQLIHFQKTQDFD